MHVKLLTNLGSNDFPGMPFLEGETREVSDQVGQKLTAMRLAIDVTPPSSPKDNPPEPQPTTAVEAKVDSARINQSTDNFERVRAANKTVPAAPLKVAAKDKP